MELYVGAKGLVVCNGKILLLRESLRYEDGTKKGKWDVPGGRIKPGEKIRIGLQREIFEESGLYVKPVRILDVFDGFPNIKENQCHIVRVYFLCETEDQEVVLSNDHDAYEWLTPEEMSSKTLVDDVEEVVATYVKHQKVT